MRVQEHHLPTIARNRHIGGHVYAMSAFHDFEQAWYACRLRVTHPAAPDAGGPAVLC